MDPVLVQLTAGALAGIARRPNGGHGVAPQSAAERGAEAVELALGAYAALEAASTEPGAPKGKPQPRGKDR
jgi:hypothetical protein